MLKWTHDKHNVLAVSEKSHRKKVLLPKHSVHLAEFFGIMLGDGGINNPWQATITLNAIKDRLYALYIKKMVKDLFGVVPSSFVYKTRDALRILANGVSPCRLSCFRRTA